jgi:chemotaxis protein CheC
MNGQDEHIDSEKKDVLREIANIGAGHAATALAALLDRPIVQSIPDVELVPLNDVPDRLGGPDKTVASGLIELSGDVSAFFMVVLNLEQADRIINMMLGDIGRETSGAIWQLSELEESVVSETVYILGGSYLTAICEMTGLCANQSTPYLCVDMVGAVLSVVLAEAGKAGDFAIVFKSELFNNDECIMGDIILLPDEQSCGKILKSLGFE